MEIRVTTKRTLRPVPDRRCVEFKVLANNLLFEKWETDDIVNFEHPEYGGQYRVDEVGSAFLEEGRMVRMVRLSQELPFIEPEENTDCKKPQSVV